MNYKSTNIEDLLEEMKNGVVTFEYTKADGSVRTARGTLNDEYLPEKLPDTLVFEKDVIDALMVAKEILTLEDYAKENGLKFVFCSDHNYVFEPLNKDVEYSSNLVRYYDIEKDHFRSFKKENFLGIIE